MASGDQTLITVMYGIRTAFTQAGDPITTVIGLGSILTVGHGLATSLGAGPLTTTEVGFMTTTVGAGRQDRHNNTGHRQL
jgi:hypothetical protein